MSAISNDHPIHQQWGYVPKHRIESRQHPRYSCYKKINGHTCITSVKRFSRTPHKNNGYEKAKKFWQGKNATSLLNPKRINTDPMHRLLIQGRHREGKKVLNGYLMGDFTLSEHDFLTAVKLAIQNKDMSQCKKLEKKIETSKIEPTVPLILALVDMVCSPECHDILKLIVKLKDKLHSLQPQNLPIFLQKKSNFSFSCGINSSIVSPIFTLNHGVFKAAIAAEDIDQCCKTLEEMKKNNEPRYGASFIDFLRLCLAQEDGGVRLAVDSYTKFWPKKFFLDQHIWLERLDEGIAKKNTQDVVNLIVELQSIGISIPYSSLFKALELAETTSYPENTEKILSCLGANAGFEHWFQLILSYARLGKAASAVSAARSIWVLRYLMYVDKSRFMEPLIDVCIEKEYFDSFFDFIREFSIGKEGISDEYLQKILIAAIACDQADVLVMAGWQLNVDDGLAIIDNFLQNSELRKMFVALKLLGLRKHTFKVICDYIFENYRGAFETDDFIGSFLSFIKENKVPKDYFSYKSVDEISYQAVNYAKSRQLGETQWELSLRDYTELFKNLIKQQNYEGIILFLECWSQHRLYEKIGRRALQTVYDTVKTNYSKNLARFGTRLENFLDNR